MIVKNMTDDALFKQLAEDIPMVARKYLLMKGNKYRRAVLKTNKFPVYFNPTEIKSDNQNTWLVYPFANSRKEVKFLTCTYLCKLQTQKETYWYTLVWDKETGEPNGIINILTPHLILRFNERLKLNKYGIELIAEYVKHKPDNYIVNGDDNTFYLRIQDGIIAGCIEGKKWIHKTFIALSDSTVGKQQKMYELLLHKILSEMTIDPEKYLQEGIDKANLYTQLFETYGEEMLQYIKGIKRWNKEMELEEKEDLTPYLNIIQMKKANLAKTLPIGPHLSVEKEDLPFIKDFTEKG